MAKKKVKKDPKVVPDELVGKGVKSAKAGIVSVEPIKKKEIPEEVKKMMEEAKSGKVGVKGQKLQDMALPKYKLIQSESPKEFEEMIVDEILHGLVPLGGVFVIRLGGTNYRYVQAVIG